MSPVWQVWALLALGVVQLGVGYWWWRGPYLKDTRLWVAGLFLVNGVSTVLGALFLQPPLDLLAINVFQRLADRVTNILLLGIALVASQIHDSWKGKLPLAAVIGLFLLATPFWLAEELSGGTAPPWADDVMSSSLYLAVIVFSVGLIRTVRQPHSDHPDTWLFCLVGIGFRFAELATIRFAGTVNRIGARSSLSGIVDTILDLGMFPFMILAFSMVIWERARPGRAWRRGLFDLSLTILLAGFLFGFARLLSQGTLFATFLSLALVRPVVFLVGQYQLEPDRFSRTNRGAHLASGGSALGASVVGVLLGSGIGLSDLGAILMGLTLGVLAFAAVRSWIAEPAEPSRESLTLDPTQLPLDPENVSLPADWRQRAVRGYQRYRTLPAETQASLEGIPRWQRILLALYAAPTGGDRPAYERTTPGLHMTTHSPYASIGSEVARTNDRWEAVLDEVAGDLPASGSVGDEPLIRSRTGRAEGLSSPRVNAYFLTPLGEEVARRLVEQLGLEAIPPSRLGEVLGEGYPEVGQAPVRHR